MKKYVLPSRLQQVNSAQKPFVTKITENFQYVHFLVDHYPEDFITRFPVYLVSHKMLDALKQHGIHDYKLNECKVCPSDDYLDFKNKEYGISRILFILFFQKETQEEILN